MRRANTLAMLLALLVHLADLADLAAVVSSCVRVCDPRPAPVPKLLLLRAARQQ